MSPIRTYGMGYNTLINSYVMALTALFSPEYFMLEMKPRAKEVFLP